MIFFQLFLLFLCFFLFVIYICMQYRLQCVQRRDQKDLVEKQMQVPLPVEQVPLPKDEPCVKIEEENVIEKEEEFKPCPLTSRIRPVTSKQESQFFYGMKN